MAQAGPEERRLVARKATRRAAQSLSIARLPSHTHDSPTRIPSSDSESTSFDAKGQSQTVHRRAQRDDPALTWRPSNSPPYRCPPPVAPSTGRRPPSLLSPCATRSEERRVGKECRSRWSP